ncbi:MAG: carboxypeptidase regulatory-like domain-containing protein [Candidatus Eisenbacteria bacterium]|nr:carboxypeptidase regulatory-like domain-containing protein [Candidatus Eisenbacteria bacterium]
MTIFDLGSPLPSGPEDNDWALMSRYSGPGGTWNEDSLGTVFGLTLDTYGNIFVTHTSCYYGDALGQVFGGGAGAVYRIDGTTGAITTFAKLPNFPDGSLTPPEDMPGLGNITYDCRHKQFFVTDTEDGKIYRIQPVGVNGPTGTVVQTFDPLGPDNALPGFAPLGERLWGIQIHGDRVFYSVWAEDLANQSATAVNSIRSVALDGAGVILPSTDKLELNMPPLQSYTGGTTPFTGPVSDISFSASGKMLLGERTMYGPSSPGAHWSRVLEYECRNFCWQRTNYFGVGDYGNQENSAGGVDYDRNPFVSGGAIGRVWASGDAIHLFGSYPDAIYGYQGFRPTGGTNVTSMLIDSDGAVNFGDKMYIGDIEAPGCPAIPATGLCGQKYLDLNHNGVKDTGEPPLAGWTIVLTGTGGTYTATTDANGNYCFTDVNPGTYTLSEVGQSGWVQTAPAGGTYAVTVVANQSPGGYDFGNYACTQTGGCVMPPPGMGAWWPFNELPGSLTAYDLTHLTPARNVAQLFGGASILLNGEVGNRLCFNSDLDYAKVVNANQLGINFAAGSFAADGWLKMAAGVGGQRMIAEKRVLLSSSPYKTRGWAIYLNGLQLFLEIGTGVATQIVPGPTVAATTWNHFAVSVDRSTGTGSWYLNGALVPAWNFVPITGTLSSNADLYMGKASPAFPSSGQFAGCVDELELFTSALPAVSVSKIYLAGAAGKCPEYCRVPQVTSICKNQNSVTICFNLCNQTATAQSYHWSLAGLPAGPGCTVAGPTVFSPPAGSVIVPAGSCSAPICVTIPRPPGLTVQNATACFALTFVNDSTGACHTCQGTIRADYSCYCITPVQSGIVNVPARILPGTLGTPIDIGVGHPCDPVARLAYQFMAVFEGTDHPDPLAVSLNGLPPGEPWIGTLDLAPGQDGMLSVAVSYPNGYDPGALYEIILEADTDGDGVMEPVCGTRIASAVDTTETVAVPPTERLQDSVRLQASPNPFSGGSSVAFALARPDDVQLGVYDLSGRLVRMLQRGPLAAGYHTTNWDGRDAQGRHAAAGIYFVRLDSPRLHLDAKLVKLR